MTILYRARAGVRGVEVVAHPSASVLTGNDGTLPIDRQLADLLKTLRDLRRRQQRSIAEAQRILCRLETLSDRPDA